jgi:hypothetical protein
VRIRIQPVKTQRSFATDLNQMHTDKIKAILVDLSGQPHSPNGRHRPPNDKNAPRFDLSACI